MSDTPSGSGSSSGNGDWSSGSNWQSGSGDSGSGGYSGSASDWPSYPANQPSAPEPYPTTPAYGQPAGPEQSLPAAQYGANQYGANPYGANPTSANPNAANPYGSNPYGSNPYAAAGYPVQYGYAPPNHPSATAAMVFGIVGIVTAIPFVGIAGFVLGRKARREIDASPQTYGGRGMATAGWVLGIIAIVYAAFVVLGVIFLIIGITASSQS